MDGRLIAIPAFDEAPTVRAVVAAARAYGPVLVVDDGSRDGTGEQARAAGAEVVRHPRRRGKASALATAFTAARGRGVAQVVTLDADGQHDAADIPALLEAAARRPRAIVVGSRLADGDQHLPRDRALAIRLAAFWVDWIAGHAIADTQSGFRVYPVALFDQVPLRGGRFVFETEVLIEAVRRGFEVCEVPVRVVPCAARASRFHPLADGLAIAAALARGGVRRWGVEVRAAGVEVAAVLSRERRMARHARVLGRAALHAGTPAWSVAVGVAAMEELGERAGCWWAHARTRRARRVAVATLASPVLLALAGAAVVAGGRLPGPLERLVRRLYDPQALPALDEGAHERPGEGDEAWLAAATPR
jgi:hypothetical protein